MQGESNVKTHGEGAIYKPRGRASGETNPIHSLILDFQPPEWWENKCPLLSFSICGTLSWQPKQTKTLTFLLKQIILSSMWVHNVGGRANAGRPGCCYFNNPGEVWWCLVLGRGGEGMWNGQNGIYFEDKTDGVCSWPRCWMWDIVRSQDRLQGFGLEQVEKWLPFAEMGKIEWGTG